jgi:hypothetical protein
MKCTCVPHGKAEQAPCELLLAAGCRARAQELELGGIHLLDPDCVTEYDPLLILRNITRDLDRIRAGITNLLLGAPSQLMYVV